ncbi:hypothetical protein H7170_03565 [Candidatus Gracilibacteria bacterium]|nr:hypothetical protein [Candidatus Gracilibacteria bacterium]
MSEIYWSGVVVAFGFTIIASIISVTQILSIRAKNLKKVELYYSTISGTFTSSEPSSYWGYLSAIIFGGLFSIFLSWIGVVSYITTYLKYFSQKSSTPEKLKELQFKIAHAHLTKKQVQDALKEIGAIMGQDISFPVDGSMDYTDELSMVLEDSPEGYFSEITLDISNKKYYLYSHSPDYQGVYNSVYEYKIEDNIIYQRLLESKIEHPGEEYYEVRDNVVMENDLHERSRSNEGPLQEFLISNNIEIILNLKKRIQWHELNRIRAYETVYFIMSNHPEIFPKDELKRIIRTDIENVKSGFLKLSEILGEYNAEFQMNPKYGSYEIVYLKEASNGEDTELANKIKYFCGSTDGFGSVYEGIVRKDELIKVASKYL